MESSNIKQRFKDEPSSTTTNNAKSRTKKDSNTNKMAMAKRGLRSLAIAVTVPLCLTLLSTNLLGSKHSYRAMAKPVWWFPPWWALQLASFGSSFLTGLSAWLVWAEGGFHQQPSVVPLFVAQLALSLAWNPVVFRAGEARAGLGICVALFGSVFGCCRSFRKINPIAADLVKPCLAWVAFLVALNVKLLQLQF